MSCIVKQWNHVALRMGNAEWWPSVKKSKGGRRMQFEEETFTISEVMAR